MSGIISQWWDVFQAWIFTPMGATLTIILILLAAALGFGRILGRGMRMVGILIGIVASLLVLFVIGGVLSHMGFPVKQTLDVLFAWIPRLLAALWQWLLRLINAAG